MQYRVYISTTGPGGSGPPDDIPEFVLVNTSLGAVLPVNGAEGFTRPNDVFRTILYRIQPDGSLTVLRLTDWNFIPPPSLAPFLDSAPFDTSVMALATTAGFLGLMPDAPTSIIMSKHTHATRADSPSGSTAHPPAALLPTISARQQSRRSTPCPTLA